MRENSSRPSSSMPKGARRTGPGSRPSRRSTGICSGGVRRDQRREDRDDDERSADEDRRRRSRPGCAAAGATLRATARRRAPRARARARPRASAMLIELSLIRGLRNRTTRRPQVDDHEDDGEEEDPALDHRVVAVEDRLEHPAADPGPLEDRLGQHRAREQQARLQADDGRDRAAARSAARGGGRRCCGDRPLARAVRT